MDIKPPYQRTRETPLPPPLPPKFEDNTRNIQGHKTPPVRIPVALPGQYRYMADLCEGETVESPIREALELYFTSVTYLNGPPWKDSLLGETLAWSFMAGFPEVCVLHNGMNVILRVGTFRFGIRGASIPQFDLLKQCFTPKARDLYSRGAECEWLPPLMDRFGINDWDTLDYREWEPNLMEQGLFKVPITARTRTRG